MISFSPEPNDPLQGAFFPSQRAELTDPQSELAVRYDDPDYLLWTETQLEKTPFAMGTEIAGDYQLRYLVRSGPLSKLAMAQTEDGRPVLIKFYSPRRHTPLDRELFEHGILHAKNFKHPHFQECVEAGSHEDIPYIVFEYIYGLSCKDILARRDTPCSIEMVLEVGMQICDALTYLHNSHLVHRDVKMANLLLSSMDSNITLIDHELLWSPELGEVFTKAGVSQRYGSSFTMAPEVIEELPFDGRADIYSLGCVLYELATKHKVFEYDNHKQLYRAHREERPHSILHYLPNIPPDFDALLFRAMEKAPQDRFQSAAEMKSSIVQLAATLD